VARIQLSKSALYRESGKLKMYKQFLPSLDLKRQQLLTERAKAVKALNKTKKDIEDVKKDISRNLFMLSNDKVDLKGLARVKQVHIDEENLMGVHLPVLSTVDIEMRTYAFMGKPHWVDNMAVKLKKMIELQVRVQVEEHRLLLLNYAVKKITQRVNLFDKVLIPETKKNISKIQIYLSDMERAQVVRAKISKNKRAEEKTLL
jgi:V/A-type H+-transporting ATPase subunit D